MDEEDTTNWGEVWTNIQEFTSDGCTMSPDLTFKECCRQHDYYYRHHTHRTTGLPISRAEADKRLRECIKRKSIGPWHFKLLPWVYWLGVRLGGRKAWNK